MLAQMKRQGSHVISTCSRCGSWDVDEMIRLLGEDGSLRDRFPSCEAGDCDGLRHFLAGPGPGTPKRPLLSPGRNFNPLPFEAWCGDWTGMR